MFELPVPFEVYNTQYNKNFLIKYSGWAGDFIDENGVVHDPKYLTQKVDVVIPHISKAGLV